MKSIRNSFRRKLKTQKTASVNYSAGISPSFLFVFVTLLLVSLSCARQTASTVPVFTDYESFVKSYSKKTDPISEIYGQYAAEQSSKRIRAKFNLLLDPGERAYIEILDPSDRLVNVLSLTRDKISLLWAKENTYIEEEATPQNLKAVIGLPVNSDDALHLISGQGLQFAAWQEAGDLKDGWKLTRGPSSATVIVKEKLSRIETTTSQGRFSTFYDKYEFLNEKSMPTRIRFEMTERKTSLELKIDKYIPRAEQVSSELFALKLPPKARKLALSDIYHGKPLLME